MPTDSEVLRDIRAKRAANKRKYEKSLRDAGKNKKYFWITDDELRRLRQALAEMRDAPG